MIFQPYHTGIEIDRLKLFIVARPLLSTVPYWNWNAILFPETNSSVPPPFPLHWCGYCQPHGWSHCCCWYLHRKNCPINPRRWTRFLDDEFFATALPYRLSQMWVASAIGKKLWDSKQRNCFFKEWSDYAVGSSGGPVADNKENLIATWF